MMTSIMGGRHDNQIKLVDHNDILPAAAPRRFAQIFFVAGFQIGLPEKIAVSIAGDAGGGHDSWYG